MKFTSTQTIALVLVVPTIDTVEEAIQARNWAYFPPLGRRSNGGGQAFDGSMYGGVPGGYRATYNDNLVLIVMIETLEGIKNAAEIAKVPGITAVFAASGDLGNFSGYAQGSPDYERLINVVHDAALEAGKRLCGPLAWRDRPDFTCFQAGSETAAIASYSQANRFIHALKELGCRFALDDFGTGLSSFGYLKHFPVDFLKIDGSFVKEILHDPIDREMVRSINEIGHLTGKQTIAEFAENPEIITMLRGMGVDYAQGYGIAEPKRLSDPIKTEAI
mgnify:CR=1 FL=1